MKDRLEEFINDHRRDFDDHAGAMLGWESFKKRLFLHNRKNVRRSRTFLISVAASFVIVVGLAVIKAGMIGGSHTKDAFPSASAKPVSKTHPLEAELATLNRLVQTKRESIGHIRIQHPLLYHEFQKETDNLDSVYQYLENGFQIYPDKELMLQKMLENREIQLDLINRQLNIVNQIQKEDHVNKDI